MTLDLFTAREHAHRYKVVEPDSAFQGLRLIRLIPAVVEAEVDTCRLVQVDSEKTRVARQLCYVQTIREFDVLDCLTARVVARARFRPCQCGGGRLGYGSRGHPGHSHWCPART